MWLRWMLVVSLLCSWVCPAWAAAPADAASSAPDPNANADDDLLLPAPDDIPDDPVFTSSLMGGIIGCVSGGIVPGAVTAVSGGIGTFFLVLTFTSCPCFVIYAATFYAVSAIAGFALGPLAVLGSTIGSAIGGGMDRPGDWWKATLGAALFGLPVVGASLSFLTATLVLLENNPLGFTVPLDDDTRLVAVATTGITGLVLAGLAGPVSLVGNGIGRNFMSLTALEGDDEVADAPAIDGQDVTLVPSGARPVMGVRQMPVSAMAF